MALYAMAYQENVIMIAAVPHSSSCHLTSEVEVDL